MNQTRSSIIAAAALLASSSSLFAGVAASAVDKQPQAPTSSDYPYVAGANEIDVGASGFWSIGTPDNARRPNLNYLLAQADYGWMLTDASGSGFFRGNTELLLGAFGGPVFDGPGHYFAGSEAFLRYNFVQPGATLVPFAQLGFGGAYSDAPSVNHVQRLIGANLSFDLETAVGVRWMFSPRCALLLEAEFRHFSNADTAIRNQGLNSVGALVGFSVFLERPGH